LNAVTSVILDTFSCFISESSSLFVRWHVFLILAIHGQPLCRSASRAINLIISNLLSAVALNSVGNFVFFMAKLVIVILTVGLGLLLKVSTE
jgi:hypothetical protein